MPTATRVGIHIDDYPFSTAATYKKNVLIIKVIITYEQSYLHGSAGRY